jgi:hypothetical protein
MSLKCIATDDVMYVEAPSYANKSMSKSVFLAGRHFKLL